MASPYYADDSVELYLGDCRAVLPDIDPADFAAHVHDLQHAVMARAAVRAYPDRYRP
jgi:hypothetical protein